jgi:DNA-binding CsgD family transcriptional regulator
MSGMTSLGPDALTIPVVYATAISESGSVNRAVSPYSSMGSSGGYLRPARPRSGWDSLTPTAHSVAALVAEGLSNPQIGERLYISSRTVQTHFAHVFAKLDISARAQLAAEVTRRSSDL